MVLLLLFWSQFSGVGLDMQRKHLAIDGLHHMVKRDELIGGLSHAYGAQIASLGHTQPTIPHGPWHYPLTYVIWYTELINTLNGHSFPQTCNVNLSCLHFPHAHQLIFIWTQITFQEPFITPLTDVLYITTGNSMPRPCWDFKEGRNPHQTQERLRWFGSRSPQMVMLGESRTREQLVSWYYHDHHEDGHNRGCFLWTCLT